MKRSMTILIAFVLAGCGDANDIDNDSFGGDAAIGSAHADSLGVTADEAAAILRLVNTASLETLDDDVALDRRAAENIVDARRSGEIASLDELDAIAWVGVRAFGKLREYVRANGLVSARPCLIISEYIEGKTDKNKAVEVYNCGTAAMDLSGVSICLVRNDDTDCTLASPLGERVLASDDTLVLCRQRVGQWMNPMPWIADACEVEIGSTAIYSGDDRLALVREANGDGELSVETDEVLDVLGRFTYRPWDSPWNDVRLERCRIEPNDGRVFYATADWFTADSWSRSAGAGLGLPPTAADCP